MDDKLSEGELKPKVTRSVARHMRRTRLLSARKAAEKDSSVLTNVNDEQANNSVITEDHRGAGSLSKSKAKRLRKRSKIENDKGSTGANCKEKLEVANSPSRVKTTSNEEVVASSTKSPIETEVLNTNNEFFVSNTIPNEHELFENEKNRKKSENSKTADDSCRCIREDYESGIVTIDSGRDTSSDLITNDCDNSRRIVDREALNDETKIISDRIEESLIIEEIEVSSIGEKITSGSKDDAGESILIMETPEICTTSKKNAGKMNSQEKTRDEIKAEREAKKAAKAAAKNKVKLIKPEVQENATSSQPVVAKTVRPPRGDVVDGEIIPMMNSIVLSSTFKQIPEVIVPLPFPASNNEEKSKSQLRAERRAKQETQRAAKQCQVTEKKEKPKVVNLITEVRASTTTQEKIDETKKIVKRTVDAHEVNLFKHLYQDKEQTLLNVSIVNSRIHPAIVRLGVQYAEKVIVGSNARCVALLAAIKQLIRDFEKPSHSDFTRSLEASLQESSKYLNRCRPIAVSMHNALRHIKWQITQLSPTTSDEEAKTKLANAIDTYIQEQIQLADKAISITIQTKISNGDVILTYGFSSLIYKILCDAHDAGRQFRVVVVDGRPWLEGREQLRRLAKHGLECSYVLINALSFIMPEVSKVFLGAHAILANGAVMSRVGTAQVALMAKSFNVPVLVACETHKSCERVQTDSIVYNELADPDELAQSSMGTGKKVSLINWRGKKSLNLLNITYDVTPADLVTAVVTELAILPCTSVPVILRIKPSEI